MHSAAPDVLGRPGILCVDGEPQWLEALALTLGGRYHVELAATAPAALEKLRNSTLAVVISDSDLPQMDGTQFLAEARRIAPATRRILLTAHTDVNSAIAAVNAGRVFRYLRKPCASADLVDAVEAAIADYEADLSEQSAIRSSVEREIAAADRTTGLASRERLLELICLSQSRTQAGAATSILLVDVASSDDVLEGFDALAADRVMSLLAKRLETHFSAADCLARSGPHSLVAVVSAPPSSTVDLQQLGLLLLDSLSQPLDLDGVALQLTMSVGVAPLPQGTEDPRVLLRHAELAARQARDEATDMVCVFTPESTARAEYRRELGRALRVALADEKLTLQYQPIVDVQSNCLHAVEALARWQDPQLGYVAPGIFIPLIEQMSLMIPFGQWTLKRACTEIQGVLGPVCPRVSVNVSVSQILDPNFMYSVYLALDSSGLSANQLEIEVTESVFGRNLDAICGVLKEVRALGIRVALDDFGAGYSSLRYLSRLPLDVVKIDGIFARDFDKGGEAIIAGALAIANRLKIDPIVEGIETEAMLAKVRELGATKIQGYLFARPMAQPTLKSWLMEFGSTVPLGLPMKDVVADG